MSSFRRHCGGAIAMLCAAAAACAPNEPTSTLGATRTYLRPDERAAAVPHFASDDILETYTSLEERFVIHFTRNGPNAVPDLDSDKSGTPDFVETAAASYEEALSFYVDSGFRAPLSDAALDSNGGDGGFDVYMVDFGSSSDGAFRRDECTTEGSTTHCSGHMVQDNDFSETSYPSTRAALRTLASHELFHAVQAAYNSEQTTPFVEGTAVWASEAFDPTLGDLDNFAGSYFAGSERSLAAEAAGPADGFSYGSGVFFEYLHERYGLELMVELFDSLDTSAEAQWDVELERLLVARSTTLSAAFFEFAEWSLATGRNSQDGVGFARADRIDERVADSASLPFSDDSARMFRLATRAWEIDPGSRGQLVARVIAVDETESNDLSLVMVSRARSGIVDRVVTTDVTQEASLAIGSGVSDVVVLLSRGSVDGPSTTPGLCIGSAAEVDDCVALLQPDAGVDASVPRDAGAEIDSGPAGVAPEARASDAGCSVNHLTGVRAPWGALAGLLLVTLSIRNRRRRNP